MVRIVAAWLILAEVANTCHAAEQKVKVSHLWVKTSSRLKSAKNQKCIGL